MASSSSTKRKRVTLTIEQKLDILKKLDQGSTISSIASEFGVGKSTVFDIKNSREKIIKFAGEAQNDSSLKSRCIVRRADDDAHDRAIHHWFIQEEAFSIGLSWLEKQSEATPMKIVLLHELHSLAVNKKHDSLKQTHITDFFKS